MIKNSKKGGDNNHHFVTDEDKKRWNQPDTNIENRVSDAERRLSMVEANLRLCLRELQQWKIDFDNHIVDSTQHINTKSVLVVNYDGDFTGGVRIDGPQLVVHNKLLVEDRDVMAEINEIWGAIQRRS